MKGTFYIDQVVTVYLTASQFSTGAALDATGSPAYRVYEQTTDTPILTGSFSVLDNASTVGLYAVSLTLSAANGFEVGKSYAVYATATVDGVAAHTLADQFVVQATIASQVPTAAAIATAVWDTLLTSYNVTTSVAAASVTNMGKAVHAFLKIVRNRNVKTSSSVVIYDNDNSTALTTSTYTASNLTDYDRSAMS
jgi:hypothetical protein